MGATNVRQQIVGDEVEGVAALLGISEDDAFLRFAHQLLTGRSLHAFDDDVVDGGQDKQIDAVTIDADDSAADVWIVQAKNCSSFSSNALVQMGNGLRWLLEASKKDLDTLGNQPFKDKILEFRGVKSELGPSNLRLHVAFVAAGSTETLSDEFEQELSAIHQRYSEEDLFESFDLRAYGHDELNDLLRARHRQPLHWRRQRPSLRRPPHGRAAHLGTTSIALDLMPMIHMGSTRGAPTRLVYGHSSDDI